MEVKLEYQVLSIIRERFSYLKYASILKEEMFETKETRFIYRLIGNHHDNHDTSTILIKNLRILLDSNIKSGEKEHFRGIIARIRKAYVSDHSIKDSLVKKFARRQYLKIAISEALDNLAQNEEADLERVRQRIDEAILVDSKNPEESYDYFKDPYKRVHQENTEERIATKMSWELDRALEGGLAPGEIGIVVAPTGVGKTLFLVNIGYGALIQGKKVVHCTLEISPRKTARRYDVRICGTSWKDLRSNPEHIRTRLKVLQTAGAGLQIKDYTTHLCSVQDLRAYLERLRSRKFKFDILIVDYADLMYIQKQYKERRFELTAIIAGLRRLAAQFKVPVWTASQATRKAGERGTTTLWDIAEDIGKANTADVAITISQKDHEKQEGIAYLRLAKTRIGRDNPKILVEIDYDTMKIKSAKPEPKNAIKRALRG